MNDLLVGESARKGMRHMMALLELDLGVDSVVAVAIEDDRSSPIVGDQGLFDDVGVAELMTKIISRSGPVVINDVDPDASVRGAGTELNAVAAFLGMAVHDSHGELRGAIAALSKSPREWSNSDIERAHAAAQAGAALLEACSELDVALSRLEDERRSRALRQRMHRLSSQAASARSLDELAQYVASQTPALVGADLAIVVVREVGGGLTVRASDPKGTGSHLLAVLGVDPENGSSVVGAALRGEELQLRSPNAIDEWPGLAGALERVGIAAVDALPLRVPTSTPSAMRRDSRLHLESVMGALVLGFESLDEPGLRQRMFLQELVRDTTSALERTYWAQREATIAEALQRSLLPSRIPDIERLRIRPIYRPAADGSRVGGDWYDIVPLGSGRVGFVIGDVAGHDLRSAAVMGQMRHVVASQLLDHESPSLALENADRYFANVREAIMATAGAMIVDPRSGSIHVALAGHLPPILITSEGTHPISVTPGAPLGAGYGGYVSQTLRPALPATLVAYTDGVVERREGDIVNHVGKLAAALGQTQGDVDAVVDVLMGSAERTGLVDDAAAVVVQMCAH